jgi:protein ImuB
MRRIVAIVLTHLACEIARQKAAATGPIGVVIEPSGVAAPVPPTATLDAVDDDARRYGVRPGQRVTEATALMAGLAVHRVTHAELDAALGRVAEVALAFGPTASVRLREAPAGADLERSAWGDAPFDTVWLDATGAAHLAGGEESLLAEIEERVAALGHRARLSIASGPRVAQALARWAPAVWGRPGSRKAGRYPIAGETPAMAAQAMATLPVQSLPIDPDTVSFLVRLGVITVADLGRLPRPAASARLGARAPEILDLAAGKDDAPLVPYAPPRVIAESTSFEEGVENTEALLFVLRGMTSRAAVRLGARGEACTRVEVEIPLDASIARLRAAAPAAAASAGPLFAGVASSTFGAPGPGKPALRPEPRVPRDDAPPAAPLLRLDVDFPAPLSDGADLLRALRVKLERAELLAPATGMRLVVSQIVPARAVQLDLARGRAADPDSLPALLAELSAEIGAERVGVLSVRAAHRPEARSRLVPITLGHDLNGASRGKGGARASDQLSFPGEWTSRPPAGDEIAEPARLLAEPIPLGRLAQGAVVAVADPKSLRAGVDPQLFAVEKISFLMRLTDVEWWSRNPTSRDYARVWLSSGDGEARLRKLRLGESPFDGRGAGACAEALVYVDKKTGEAFLQGWFE